MSSTQMRQCGAPPYILSRSVRNFFLPNIFLSSRKSLPSPSSQLPSVIFCIRLSLRHFFRVYVFSWYLFLFVSSAGIYLFLLLVFFFSFSWHFPSAFLDPPVLLFLSLVRLQFSWSPRLGLGLEVRARVRVRVRVMSQLGLGLRPN